MNSRKGILVPETLGIILALIGLVALGFLGIKLYNMFVEQDLKNAQAFVDGLSSKIEALDENAYCDLPQASPPSEVGFSPLKCEVSNTFAMRGIEGWVLVGWNKSVPIADNKEVISAERKPQKCFDKNCLCLCETSPSNCQENGYCRGIDRNVTVVSRFEILNYASSSVDLGGMDNPFTKAIVSCYLMPSTSLLIPFNVLKTKDFILITTPVHDIKTQDDYKTIRTDIEKCSNYKYAFFEG